MEHLNYLNNPNQLPPNFFLTSRNKPTLASNNVHLERGMVVPRLHVEAEEPRAHGMLEVGDLHFVTVRVPTQKLNIYHSKT